MTLPYRWRPLGADHFRLVTKLKPGDLVAFNHAVWRVIKVHPKPEDEEYPYRVIFRPVEINTGDVRDRDHDKAWKVQARTWFDVYPNEHYPVCATCHEPVPCRDQMAEEVSAYEAEQFDHYTTAGICPACLEPVSQRQKSITWEDNAVVPGGPPVTFHLRNACWSSARTYEQRWAQLDPNRRKLTLTCTGHLARHVDGSSQCTELAECPGPKAWHSSYENHYPGHSTCYCVAGDANG
jgi:hypothetical protein